MQIIEISLKNDSYFMIKYNLKCNNNHEFESWFSDSEEFNKLNKKKLLECIYCSSNKIEKSIMAPMISGMKLNQESVNILDKKLLKEKKELIKLREHIEKNFEFVGDKLSKKIRDIYYDKDTKKSIYGTATPEERKELAEEGIDLLSIPWVSKDN
tara:strand:- start:2339 stop:2803 length:465 start_codon:yes stop_codon:yes gene_type:complete